MSPEAWNQLFAVFLGGLLTIAGSIVTTTWLERQRAQHEARKLALAFKGEVTAILEHISERGYGRRINEVIDQMETTQEPFFMAFRIRYQYDRIYDNNAEHVGTLPDPLPEMIPLFYTRLASMMEDMSNLGEGVYATLPLPVLLRVHRDMLRILESTVALGGEIIAAVDARYEQA